MTALFPKEGAQQSRIPAHPSSIHGTGPCKALEESQRGWEWVGITLVLARGHGGKGRLCGHSGGCAGFFFFFGGRTTTLDTHAIDDAARLPAWSFPGGEDMLATHSPRQQMLLSLEDDDMDDGIATSSIQPWLLPSSTSLGAN